MMEMMAPMGIFVLGVLVFGGAVFVVRRFVNLASLQPNNETVPHYLGIVVGVYGIFSGFVIVSLWEQQRQAEDNVVKEASELRAIFRLATTITHEDVEDVDVEEGLLKIQESAIAYARAVVDREWPLLVDPSGDKQRQEEKEDLHHTHPEKDQLWTHLVAYGHANPESAFFDSLLSHYEALSDSRRIRCYDAQRSLPLYLWMVFILGSVLSIACTLFIGAENIRAQAALTGISGGLLLLLMFVVYDLQNPFRGYWTVDSKVFRQARFHMEARVTGGTPNQVLQAGDTVK